MNRFLSLIVTVALCSLTGRANVHAFPQNAIPAAGSVLAQAPTEVVMTFTEALEPRFSSLQVLDTAGARVDTGPAQTAPSDGRIFSTHVWAWLWFWRRPNWDRGRRLGFESGGVMGDD